MRFNLPRLVLAGWLCAALLPAAARAQGAAPTAAPTPAPQPAQTTPAPAAPAPTAPPAAAAQPTTPEAAKPDAPVDPSVGEPVTLEAGPALVLKGQASWDSGFETLVKAFATLKAAAATAKLDVSGRPRVFFEQTDDNNFTYQALLPLAAMPAPAPALPDGVTLGETPAGKTLRFPNTGPYDDIDSVYEAITAYLDEKGIVAKGTFMEEYLGDLKDSADPALALNIYVFLQ